jgi:hypothetical protein
MKLALLAIFLALPLIGQVTNTNCPAATGIDPHCVIFNWTPAPLGTGYNIYTGGTKAGNCNPVTATTCTKLGSVAGLATSTFTFNTTPTSFQLPDGQTFFFVITTVNGTAESVPSTEVSGTTPFLVPGTPTGFGATIK